MASAPTIPRPQAPYERADWEDLPAPERSLLNQQYRRALDEWWIEGCGLQILPWDSPTEIAKLACPDCIADTCGAELLVRGQDSHGDCAEHGGPVYLVEER